MNKIRRAYRCPATIIVLCIATLLFLVEFWIYHASGASVLRGLLEFPAVIAALALLCPALEGWLGSKKLLQLLACTAAFALLTGIGILLMHGRPLTQIGFAGSMYLLCLAAGVALTLSFTGGDKTGEIFRLRPMARIVSVLVLFTVFVTLFLEAWGILSLPQGSNLQPFSYCLSVGAFGGMYFSWQNQAVTKHRLFDQTRALPPYQKLKWKQYPGTLCLLGISILIAVIAVATVPRQHLLEVYGGTGFGAWFRYIFLGIFNWRLENVLIWTGISRETLWKGQIWRLFTSPMMHFGALHILGNGAALYLAGKYVEPRVGTVRCLGIFYASFWFGTLLTLLSTERLHFNGASVGIYPLVAVFFLLAFKKDERMRVRSYEIVYLLGYVFVGELLSYGHFPFFSSGLALAFLCTKRSVTKSSLVSASENRLGVTP